MSSQSYFFNPQDDRMSCAGSGLQLPRLSSTQRLALTVGVNDAGLQVFDTTLQSTFVWTGTAWAQTGGSSGEVITVDNIAALKSLTVTGLADGQVIMTRGYYTENDGGQGTYVYDSGSVAVDNGGTVIAPTAGAGRYLLLNDGVVNVRQFGAKGDGVADDRNSFQAACIWATGIKGTITIPSGNYRIVGGYGIVVGSNVTLRGEGGRIWVSLPTGYVNPCNWTVTEIYTLNNQLNSAGVLVNVNMATYAGYSLCPWNGKGIVFTNGTNCRIENLWIDGGWGTAGAPSGVVPILGVLPISNPTYGSREEPAYYQIFGGFSDSEFVGCNFQNVPGSAVTVGSNNKILDCSFGEYGDHVIYYAQTSFDIIFANNSISASRVASGTVFTANYIFATERDAVKLRCVKRAIVSGNIYNCPGAQFLNLGTIDNAPGVTDLENVVVSENNVTCRLFAQVTCVRNALGSVVSDGCRIINCTISNNIIKTTSYVISSGFAHVYPSTGIAARNFVFSENTVDFNPTASGTSAFLICGNQDFSTPLENVSFRNNSFRGTAPSQLYYDWFNLQGQIYDVEITSNSVFNSSFSQFFASTTYGTATLSVPQSKTVLTINNNHGINVFAWIADDIAQIPAWNVAVTYSYSTVTFADGFVRTLQNLAQSGGLLYVNTATVTGGAAPAGNPSWTIYSRPTCRFMLSGNSQVATVAAGGLEALYLTYFSGATVPTIYSINFINNFKATTTGGQVRYLLGPGGLTDTTWFNYSPLGNLLLGSFNGTTLTTGANNTLVGNGANVNAGAVSGCIVLGNSATSNAAIATGHLSIGSATVPIATAATATAGGSGAIPATVAGYVNMSLNGVQVKVPYYNP